MYWTLQIGGWFFYILIAFILNQFRGVPLSAGLIVPLISAYVIGLGLSHLYRLLIIRLDWLRLNIFRLVPRILIATLLFSAVFELLYFGFTYSFFYDDQPVEWVSLFQEFLGWEILFLLWSMFYFIFHIFRNYKNEEIKNLRWEATKNEVELNKLKSQLNPHFIFNAMNSIRALVDEEPKKAKRVITQLSNVLRNNLLMGRKKLIPLSEELILVKDYLEIEKARYEERLEYAFHIDPLCEERFVPPLMVQTLVENGIKHGISKLPKGGKLEISASLTNKMLDIKILNHGRYHTGNKSETGFGIENTKERLRLLFGEEAQFYIQNLNGGQVETRLTIPQTKSIAP